MPVHIDEISSEVTAVSDTAPAQAGGGEREWEQWDRLRAMQRRLAADSIRTSAEGFDD